MIAANNLYAGFVSWEDQLKIQERVQLKLQQEHQAQQSGNSSKVPPKITKKRQTSLVEFMG